MSLSRKLHLVGDPDGSVTLCVNGNLEMTGGGRLVCPLVAGE
ncbi:hypothetical protein [Pseudarthrobacter sp. J47]|nr:hypothetical protein [Pseudarthrobacter sp. J47]MEE2524695.1 hypothetical protein [Pseudarthrobacter sp. J47]